MCTVFALFTFYEMFVIKKKKKKMKSTIKISSFILKCMYSQFLLFLAVRFCIRYFYT